MDKYKQERASRISQAAQANKPKIAMKQFAEDAEEEKKAPAEEQKQEEMPEMQAQAASTQVQASTLSQQPQSTGFFGSIANALGMGSKKKAKANNSGNEEVQELDRNLSCEEMDSDDLGGDLNLSDQEDGAMRRGMKREIQAVRRTDNRIGKAHKYRAEFDTNVFEVALNCLTNQAQLATGDAEICAHCQAVFNKSSVLTEKDGKQIWKCEFCYHENEVMIDEEEIPSAFEMTYLLEAAA